MTTFNYLWLLTGFPVAFALGWMASRFDVRQLQWEIQPKLNERLQADVRAAVLSSNPTWLELSRLTLHNGATTADLYSVLLSLERGVLIGQDKELTPHRESILEHIQKYQSLEPFSQVPERIRPHLYKLHGMNPEGAEAVQALTVDIEDLAEVNRIEKVKERRRSGQAYVVGFLGILIAVIAFLFPNVGPAIVKLVLPAQTQ